LSVARIAEQALNVLPAGATDPGEQCSAAVKGDRIRKWREYLGGAIPNYLVIRNSPIERRFAGGTGGKSQSLKVTERSESLKVFDRFSRRHRARHDRGSSDFGHRQQDGITPLKKAEILAVPVRLRLFPKKSLAAKVVDGIRERHVIFNAARNRKLL
jgi:hypothetical protein